jgi:hypothetical protein
MATDAHHFKVVSYNCNMFIVFFLPQTLGILAADMIHFSCGFASGVNVIKLLSPGAYPSGALFKCFLRDRLVPFLLILGLRIKYSSLFAVNASDEEKMVL